MRSVRLKKNDWYCEEDHILWSRLRNGKQQALEELFKRYHYYLVSYGITIIADYEIVNDAIQKVFLRIWKNHSQLSQAKSVKAYLRSSLRRSIFRKLKRITSRNKRSKIYLDERSEQAFSIEQKLIQEEISKELAEKLQKALQALTPRQKEAVCLRFYNGLTIEEISGIIEINYQCVSNLLYRAISKLRTSMRQQSIVNYPGH